MKNFLVRNIEAVVIMLIVLYYPVSSHAQSTKQQIEELKKQIEIIQLNNQKQIEELKRQIEALESERVTSRQNIAEVSEKRKEDEDVWFKKFIAKYDKGLTFQSDDGNFKMRFRIQGQFQLSVNDTDQELTSTDFRVRRLRFKWDGHAFKPWFLYTVVLEATDDIILRDLYFTAVYKKEIGPRFGQFKVPFYREQLTSSTSLQLVDRSIVNDEFTLERDLGATLLGGIGDGTHFSYQAGVFNGDGTNGTSVDSNLLYAGRIQLGFGGEGSKFDANDQFPAAKAYEIVPNFAKNPTLVAGASIAAIPGLNCDRKTPGGDVCDRIQELDFPQSNFTTITGDVNFKTARFSIEGEYVGRWLAPDSGPQDTAYDQGFNVQGGVFLLPSTIEVAGRYSFIDYDTSSGVIPLDISVQNMSWALTPGLNYYISHDQRWKIQIDYSFIRNTFTEDSPNIDENIFRAQLQAYF